MPLGELRRRGSVSAKDFGVYESPHLIGADSPADLGEAMKGFSLPGESYFVQALGSDLAAAPDVRRIRDPTVVSDEADQLEGSRQFGQLDLEARA